MDRALDDRDVRNRRLRRGAVVVTGVAGLAILLIGLPRLLRPAVRRGTIRTATVERGDVEALLQASGTVLPAFERVVTSPIEARVLRVLHRPGDAVRAGDPVVELDTTATRLELGHADEQLGRKRSELRHVGLDLDRQLSELGGRREAKQLDTELHGYRLEQQRRLHVDGLTSEIALRQAEVELRKAEVELRQLDDSLENARRSAAERQEALGREAAVLEQELEATRQRLTRAEARADAAGVLTSVVSEAGSTVRQGDVLARIAGLDAFRIEATVADAYASRVEAGQPVRVRVDDSLLGGRVGAVHPAVEAGAARFDVTLDDPAHDALRPNRRVDVYVVTDVRPGALRVAKGAFARTGRRQPVFVVRGERAWRVEAEIGVTGYEHFEIVDGLSDGDVVIVSDMKEFEHLESVRLR